jgi:cytochrome P450
MQDPYPHLAELRESMPAAVVQAGGFRMWLITRYEDVRRILADPDVCKDMVGRRREIVKQSLVDSTRNVRLPHEARRSVLDRDGDDHRRLRSALTRCSVRRISRNCGTASKHEPGSCWTRCR